MSLHIAVRKNNIEEVKNLLQRKGTEVNTRDGHGNTALHLARDKSIGSLLINACADPNLQNENGDTPLHTWHVISLEHGIPTDSAPGGMLEIISLLLASGASPNIRNNHGYNSLHSLLVHGGIAGLNLDAHFMNDFISLLLQFNVNVNMTDFEGCTPLHHAVKEPHMHNAETLIAAGALVDARDYRGLTPLQHIFHSDNTDMVQLLLKRKADINAQDLDGRSTLSTAVEVGNEEIVQLLLQDPQVCVNLADKNKVTPLHLAASFKHVDLTKMLIQASADLNARDALNATPLHYAAYGGTPEIVTMLLEACADDKVKDNSGWLAVQYALSRHYYHTALQFGEEYLRDVTASVRESVKVADTAIEDIIVQSLPADDIFTMVVPASKVYSDPFDFSITPDDDLVEYTRAKSKGNLSRYLQNMSTVPGVGRIPMNIQEVDNAKPELENVKPEADKVDLEVDDMESEARNMKAEDENINQDVDGMKPEGGNMKAEVNKKKMEDGIMETEIDNMKPRGDDLKLEASNMKAEAVNIRHNIEKFMSKWTEKIAEIDERFAGTLFQSGSVYEGTKVGEPDEFDYMLCLEKLASTCAITFDEVTEYDKITVHKNLDDSESAFSEFFDGRQLESGKVMSAFVDVAKIALTKLDYNSVPNEMYIEGLTEHTLVEDTFALHGTVTCNLKFKWAGLYYKQLVITVDLVPAIPVRQWPHVARQASHLLTDDIRSRGCHLVPKAGYWRLSFSLAEKLIMQSLSWEQKSAFVGAKVTLHPAVTCKITVYDDSHTFSEEDCDDGLQSNGACDPDVQDETVEGKPKMQMNKEVSSLTNRDDDASFSVGSSGSNNETRSLPVSLPEVSSLTNRDDDASFSVGSNGSNDETRSLPVSLPEVSSLTNRDDDASFSVGSNGSNDETRSLPVSLPEVSSLTNRDDDASFSVGSNGSNDETRSLPVSLPEVSSLTNRDDDASFSVGSNGSNDETRSLPVSLPEVSSLTNRDDDASFSVGSSGRNNETSSLLFTMVGRTVSQSGDVVTILKLASPQDSQVLKELTQNNPADDVRVDLLVHPEEFTSDDGSDVCAKTLLPVNVLSTYLLKNLFFNCIEQNAKDATGTIVTTEQLFSNLFHSLRENRRVPYYFMPTQSFCGLEALSDDVHCDLVLVTTIINSLLNEM